MKNNAIKTAKKLGLVAVAMFGFGYLMVPIYDVLCDITGFTGKTGQISQSQAKTADIDLNRLVTVQFDTNVNPALPWKFKAAKFKQTVRPGEIAEAIFTVENTSNKPVIGQAIPSVAPEQASLFFNKTECFCFEQQKLLAGERVELPVIFIIDPNIPLDIGSLSLGYTLFDITDQFSENQIAAL